MDTTDNESISSTTPTHVVLSHYHNHSQKQHNTKGHHRSSSLENNAFIQSSKISLNFTPNFTGTLKSRREQKRISDFLCKQQNQNDSSIIRKAHFDNIREIFEKKSGSNKSTPTISQPNEQPGVINNNDSNNNRISGEPLKIQSCSGILGKGKQAIRPIAFKPVPYKSKTPNYGGKLTDLSERYGSTPSLAPPVNIQHKFGSSTDLHHHHYSTLNNRKNSSALSFKTYDSLESILKLPDSMALSYGPNSSMKLINHVNLLDSPDMDMTPSPSDLQDLEAALRDRDSELAYLRQTMEHNEQVIFKVHQDKERSWEQELGRLKQIHESRLRAGAQKVHKLEQLLMMQTFQLRQDKKRLQEDVSRIHTEFNVLKVENEMYKSDISRYKLNEKDLNEQNSDLMDEIQMLRRVVSDLKERLEYVQTENTIKDQEIIQLRSEIKTQNLEQPDEVKKQLDIDLEMSQLNRIIIFKDQIIVVMNNEIQKLRKELSDMSLVSGYENAPSGRYSRFKKKLDMEGCILTEKLSTKEGNEADCDEENLNYVSNRIDMDKKFFLSTQICNYSDEDKIKDMLECYNNKNLPDITLNLSAINQNSFIIDSFFNSSDEIQISADSTGPLSDDDYKSMTPITLDNEEYEQVNDEKKINEMKELEKYKENFDRERIKWIEEKEKVLVYQRKLQANYLEMSKRTQILEEKLKKIEKK